MSNASVLNLLLISFDRYFSVTRPLTYRPRRTTRKALIMIAGTYILSAVLWPPWIIGWPYIEGKFTVEEGVCVVQFLALSGRNWATQLATVGTAIAAFYLPVTIMIILYYRVFRETKRRQEEFRRLQSGQFSPMQYGASSALHSLMLPLVRNVALPIIRGMGARAAAGAYPVSSSFGGAASVTSENAPPSQPEIATSILKRQLFPFSDVDAKPTKPKGRLSWLKYCVGKTPEMQSEDSSDGIAQAMDDTSCTSSMYAAGSIRKPKHTSGNNLVNLEPDQVHMTKADSSQSPLSSPLTAGNHLNGSCARFRTRVGGRFTNNIPDRGPEKYGSEGKRPSVRLSSCDQQSAALDGPTTKDTAEEPTDQCLLLKKKRHSAADVTTIGNGQVSTSIITKSNSANLRAESDILEIGSRSSAKRDSQNSTCSNLQFQNRQMNSNGRSNICGTAVGTGIKHMSGSASLREEHIRKSEKERRKNERKQESKAAKTLSAILFAFIVTWTPYNVIVCWEAFFPNSIPDVLFTFSYCLCYVNSTINPLCYALCNARFRMTYMRILRCKNWKPGHKASLYRHAYLRRA
ncbi:7 transmembrane receptor (rhodopsin family) domain-containing protein [Ditylenchus destructor]|nr:7 transmembrane receptor (rhodopsin family) domain-containing protein [Ditylenchus destructor]